METLYHRLILWPVNEENSRELAFCASDNKDRRVIGPVLADGANDISSFQPGAQTAAFVYDSQAFFLEFIFF